MPPPCWTPHPANPSSTDECFAFPAGAGSTRPPCATRCADLGAACGSRSDGCGGTLDCGACPVGATCDAQGQCTPLTWHELPLPVGAGNFQDISGSPDSVWLAGTALFRVTDAGVASHRTALGNPLAAVAATSGDEAWTWCITGDVLHWLDGGWSPSGTTRTATWIVQMSASTRADVWALDQAGAVHYDGQSWQDLAAAGIALSGVSGSGPDDVWFATSDGMLHRDGAGTLTEYDPGVSGGVGRLWADSPFDAWGLAFNGHLVHWDGTRWGDFGAGPLAHYAAIWAAGANEMWAVNADTVAHWDGSSFTTATFPGVTLTGVWGRSPTDVYLIGNGPPAAKGHLFHLAP